MTENPGEIAAPVLRLESVVSGYRKRAILNGVSLHVNRAEIVALIGHNGAGKSTLLKTIFGLVPVSGGTISLNDSRVPCPRTRDLLRARVTFVPQGNRVFTDLTVYENLLMGGATLASEEAVRMGVDRVFTLFPLLKDWVHRRAGTLSGGEKQILAIASALVVEPRVLLIDEPSLGLAPSLVRQALQSIQQINHDNDVAILIVEQKVREVLEIADRVYVLRNGRVSFAGKPDELKDDRRLSEVYL